MCHCKITISYETLQIIEGIFKFLNLSDRLVASTVCLSWYEASLASSFWKNVALVIENSIDDASVSLKSTRKPFQHVKIKVGLSIDDDNKKFLSSNHSSFILNYLLFHILGCKF